MSFYRSEEVAYFKLVLPRESAWEIMDQLGQKKILHIANSDSPALTRPFLSQIKRIQEALTRLHQLQHVLDQQGVYSVKDSFTQAAYNEVYHLWEQQYEKSNAHPMNVLNDIIAEVDNAWKYHQQLLKHSQELANKMQHYRDNLAVLKAGEARFGRAIFTHTENRVQQVARGLSNASQISMKCGVINLEEQLRFKKTIFRITKGNSLITCIPFSQVFTNLLQVEQRRVVFYVLYPGSKNSYLDNKLSKLIENFSQAKYNLPQNQLQYATIFKNLEDGIVQAQNLMNLTQKELTQFLGKLGQMMVQSEYFRRHEYLKLYMLKEKELYSNLNEMEFFNNFLQSNIYVLRKEITNLQEILKQLEMKLNLPSGHLVPAQAQKYPTSFTTNDYTRSAQEIVQTYGVANYQQANPAFFTCITFPFLFGVMFGDIGHGLIVFGFGIYMVFFVGEESTSSVFRMLRPHRYMVTLMGFFSAYCGFIYNDYLSLTLDLFGSCFNTNGVQTGQPIPQQAGCVYPFGLDPVWGIAQNNLVYTNSLKMKISVIIGVVHMILGIFVKASNTLYFGRYLDFFCEFLPQLGFMALLFGYMDFLIIYKWCINWGYNSANAPSVITTMINIPLDTGHTDDCCGGQPMWGTYGDTSQDTIQLWFLVVAVICIPWMLLPKPIVQICRNRQNDKLTQEEDHDPQHSGRLLASSQNMGYAESVVKVQHKSEHHSSDQIFVHQLIETIEYVLGCISNTASYLRLWALSLAHSQLSEVFFQKLLQGAFCRGYVGIPLMVIGWILLGGISFGILLCMDTMECFLHTLRLHWVEFNNKFYKGNGFSFTYFSFTNRLISELAIQA